MNSHDELLDSVAAYALGAAFPAEAAEVARICRRARRAAAEYEAASAGGYRRGLLGRIVRRSVQGADVASPMLKARIMKQVRAEAASKPARARGRPTRWRRHASRSPSSRTLGNLSLRNQLQSRPDEIAAQLRQNARQAEQNTRQRGRMPSRVKQSPIHGEQRLALSLRKRRRTRSRTAPLPADARAPGAAARQGLSGLDASQGLEEDGALIDVPAGAGRRRRSFACPNRPSDVRRGRS